MTKTASIKPNGNLNETGAATAFNSRPGSTVRRLFLAALLTLLLGTGVTVATPDTASAATLPTASYCLAHNTGQAYTHTAYAQVYRNGTWQVIGSGTVVGPGGCGTFYMPANSYVRVLAFTSVGSYFWVGTTTHALTTTGGNVNLGRGIVYQYRY